MTKGNLNQLQRLHQLAGGTPAFEPSPARAWDSCEVRYRVHNCDAAHDLGLCDDLPHGWVVGYAQPLPGHPNGFQFELAFEVQGEPTERDGVIVRRILERLGML